MMQITLITVGTLKEQYLRSAADEYKKRLSAHAEIREINLREARIANEDDANAVAQALESEADAILSHVPRGAIAVALCVEGKQLSSEELAAYVRQAQDSCGKLCFIIGSSHGLSPRVKAAAALRLSFSRLTFPHQLMRVLLLEAIYRSQTILAGKKYHK